MPRDPHRPKSAGSKRHQTAELDPKRRQRNPDVRADQGLENSLCAQMCLPAYRGMLPHIHTTDAALQAPRLHHGIYHRVTLQSAYMVLTHEMRTMLRELGGPDLGSVGRRHDAVAAFMRQSTARQQTTLMPLMIDVSARLAMRDLLLDQRDAVVFDIAGPTDRFRVKGVNATLAYLLEPGRYDDPTLYHLAARLLVDLLSHTGNAACVLMHLSWATILFESGRHGDFKDIQPNEWVRTDTWEERWPQRVSAEQALQRVLLAVRLACTLRCHGRPLVGTTRAGTQTADCSAIGETVRRWWRYVRTIPVTTLTMPQAVPPFVNFGSLEQPVQAAAELEEGELAAVSKPSVAPFAGDGPASKTHRPAQEVMAAPSASRATRRSSRPVPKL